MKVTISNTDDLLEFIATDAVSDAEALEIANAYLDCYFDKGLSKATLIRSVEHLLDFNLQPYDYPFFPEAVN